MRPSASPFLRLAGEAHWGIIADMGNPDPLVGGIYVVQASRDGVTGYWAAATIREDAVPAVQKAVGPEWTVTRTGRRLIGQRLSLLNLRPNGVEKLTRQGSKQHRGFGLHLHR